jgi:hypothetical protein
MEHQREKIRENMNMVSIRSVEYRFSDSIRCVSIRFVSIRCVSIRFVKYTFREYTFCEYTFCKCIYITVSVTKIAPPRKNIPLFPHLYQPALQFLHLNFIFEEKDPSPIVFNTFYGHLAMFINARIFMRSRLRNNGLLLNIIGSDQCLSYQKPVFFSLVSICIPRRGRERVRFRSWQTLIGNINSRTLIYKLANMQLFKNRFQKI